MTDDRNTSALAQDLTQSIDELQSALLRASEATARIKSLVPRVGAVNRLLDEIESVIQTGRQELGARTTPPEAFTRPTLVVAEAPEPVEAPVQFSAPQPEPIVVPEPQPQPQTSNELISFRLEFQSSGGPLDLRAVDDAVGEHPAVRDVALLDYDGRNATLKVWIVPTASAAEVQESLSARAATIFANGNEVTIIALEDAA